MDRSTQEHDATFRAVSDITRRRILDSLAGGNKNVSELCSLFDVTQSAVSQHLKVLRDAGLVRTTREGRMVYYELDPQPMRAVFDWVAHYQTFWTNKLDALGRTLDRVAAKRRGGDP
ncbi:ArsR/SmtB family transcription factor [Pendulispora albinea]|uniref:Metalloregulator ArsR/SmtB family transcription factor n=1 Tax=Pendulispora albinea TaxID=2741071 RepID=A0ABZ2LZD0_9BACT